MIIWIASYPRSGNTFFRLLLQKVYGFETFSIYNNSANKALKRFYEIMGDDKLPMSLEEMNDSNEIFFVKTHNLPSDNYPAIYLVRDGRDALISHAKYIKSFNNINPLLKIINYLMGRNNEKYILKKLIVSNKLYGGWSQNLLQWKNRKGKTFIIKYEDLIEDPIIWIDQALDAMNCKTNVKCNTLPNFEELHQKMPDFFRKGKTGYWKNEMPDDLHKIFLEVHGSAMKELEYI